MGHVKGESIGVPIGKDRRIRHFAVPSVGKGGKPLTQKQKQARVKGPGFKTHQEADRAIKRASAAGQKKRAKRMGSQVAAAKRSKSRARQR